MDGCWIQRSRNKSQSNLLFNFLHYVNTMFLYFLRDEDLSYFHILNIFCVSAVYLFRVLICNAFVCACLGSGSTDAGSTSSSTTGCRLWTVNCYTSDLMIPTNSGVLFWKRLTPSKSDTAFLLQRCGECKYTYLYLLILRLHGSFANLIGGHPVEAMVDFTGGISERFDEDEFPYDLYKILLKAYEQSALMCCSVQVILFDKNAEIN